MIPTLSASQTREVGRRLGECLVPGAVVSLVGELGAGKTVFARGVARGLGVSEETWAGSPSFVLVQRYVGRLPLAHIDLYRIARAEEVDELGWDEAVWGEGAALVEWGDRFPGLLGKGAIRVEIVLGEGDERTIRFAAEEVPGSDVLAEFAKARGP